MTETGFYQTNELSPDLKDQIMSANKSVYWDTPNLKIIRFRLLSDPGHPDWDISYCYGKVNNEVVRVYLPFDSLPKKGWKTKIVHYAIKDNVFAKRLGILDDNVVSMLC